MPDLTGLTVEQAEEALVARGFPEPEIDQMQNGSYPTEDWRVSDTDPSPGQEVREGAKVVLTADGTDYLEAEQAHQERMEEDQAEAEAKAKTEAAEQEKADEAAKKEAEVQAKADAKAEAERKKYEDEWVIRYILESDAPIDLATYTTMVGGSTNQTQDASATQTKLVKTLKYPSYNFGGTYAVWSFGVSGMASAYATTITCKVEINGKIVQEQTSKGAYATAMCNDGGYEVNF